MQHSPRVTAFVCAMISVATFGLGWVVLHALEGWDFGDYLPFFAAAMVGTVWGAWGGYRTAKKRIERLG